MTNIFDRKLEEWFLVGSFLSMVFIVFLQVVFRYTIDIPLGWTSELSRYMLIWIAWLSTSYAIRENRHIRIEFLKNILPPKGQVVLELIVLVIWGVFATFLAYIGITFVTSIQESGQGSPMMGIPMWIIYLVLPLTGILMIIRLIQQVFFIYKKQEYKVG